MRPVSPTQVVRLARRSALALLALAAFAAPALAETAPAGDPKKAVDPKKDDTERPFTIAVLGDSLADGMWGSLYRGYVRQQKTVAIRRYAVNSAGFTAHNFEVDLEKALGKEKVDLIVFMVGANDRQRTFAVGNHREWAQFKTEKWHALYQQNIKRFLAEVQSKKIPLVWIGLPIMRKEDAAADAKMMNGIYRDVVAEHGMTFAEIWGVTANKDGEYDPFLEDDKGRKRRFRADDGVHFTELGYDHVARAVWKIVREKHPQFAKLWSVPEP